MTDCPDNSNDEFDASFPENSSTENKINKVSALCSYGMRPHVMTGFLRQLLIGHFSDPQNIEEPRIRRQVETIGAWRPESTDTGSSLNPSGILIESITRWAPNNADKRPAILIRRNSWRWSSRVIGDKLSENVYTGETEYSGFWEGSHTLFCLAPNGAEAEFLSTEVVKFLTLFSPLIRQQMDFFRFMIGEIGGVGEVQEVMQGYAVPITVTYVAHESWSIQPYVPRLKRIVFKASDLLSG
jgi:hypothetical protein